MNTTDSRVELSFDVASSRVLPPAWRERALVNLRGRLVGGVLTVAVQRHRSQVRNRELALTRLAGLLADATAPPGPRRRPTRPSRAARRRRMSDKRRRGAVKQLRSRPDEE